MPGPSATNPYSPPLPEAPSSTPGQLWSLSQGVLMLSDGARLPPVNLLGPQDDPDIIPVTISYRTRPWLPAGLILIIALPVIALLLSGLDFTESMDLPRKLFVPGLPLAEMIILVLALRSSGPVKVRYFASRERLLAQSRRVSRVRRFVLAVTCLLIAGRFVFGHFPLPLLGLGLTLLLLPPIWLTHSIRPCCARIRGKWAHLSRVDPAALARLSTLATAPPPLPRTISAYTLNLHKFPMARLIDGSWNRPWTVISAAIVKVFGKKVLTVDFPSDSDATPLPLIPPPLAAMVAELPGPSWQILRSRRHEALGGNQIMEILDLISPDLCHTASPSISTAIVSRGRVPELIEIKRWTFATVLTDGTVVNTRTSILGVPIAHFESHQIRGAPQEIWEKHLAHVGGRPIQPASEDQWLARFDQWNEAVHEALVTAGLRGPLREVTVPAETPLSPVTIS